MLDPLNCGSHSAIRIQNWTVTFRLNDDVGDDVGDQNYVGDIFLHVRDIPIDNGHPKLVTNTFYLQHPSPTSM